MVENSFKKCTTNVKSRQAVDDVSAAACFFGKNYDHEMNYKMHSNIQYLCHKCGIGNSLAKCRHLLTIAGHPENPVFLKHVIVTISVFPKWDHLKKIWLIMKMESIKRITFY